MEATTIELRSTFISLKRMGMRIQIASEISTAILSINLIATATTHRHQFLASLISVAAVCCVRSRKQETETAGQLRFYNIM